MLRTCWLLGVLMLSLRIFGAETEVLSAVDAKMKEFMADIPASGAGGTGPAITDKNGKSYLCCALSDVAGVFVPLGKGAVADLIKYLDNGDPKIRFIAVDALEKITDVYRSRIGLVYKDCDCLDVKSAEHAKLKAAFKEWLERSAGAFVPPGPGFVYTFRSAKVAIRKEEEDPKLPKERYHSFMLSDGKVGILSGRSGDVSAAIFDPQSETIVYRESGRATGVGFAPFPISEDRFYLHNESSINIYDFRKDAFQSTDNAFPLHVGFAWTALPDGKVFLCGGKKGKKYETMCALFDPRNNTFSKIGDLIVARARHTATWLGGDKILIAGGEAKKFREPSLDSLEIFDLAKRTSALLEARMNAGRRFHAAINLGDGKVLIAGGCTHSLHSYNALQSAEVFDPALGRIVPVASMGIQRSDVYLAMLSSGRVAVAGGDEDTRLVEIYCPLERKFMAAGQLMLEPRKWMNGSPLVLQNGELLFAGGWPNSSNETLTGIEFFSEKHLAEDVHAGARPEPPKELDHVPGKVEPWCVELYKNNGAVEKNFMPMNSNKEKCVELFTHFDKDTVLKVVVRFPPLYLYEQQCHLFDLVGKSRFPNVFLGPPLEPNEK